MQILRERVLSKFVEHVLNNVCFKEDLRVIVLQACAVLAGVYLKDKIHSDVTPDAVFKRHAFSALVGFLMCFTYFSWGAFFLLFHSVFSYVIFVYADPSFLNKLLFSTSFLMNLIAQQKCFGMNGTNIFSLTSLTLCMKIASLCLHISDGKVSAADRPNFWAFLGYTLDFHTIFTGPVVSYNDYLSNIEGRAAESVSFMDEAKLECYHSDVTTQGPTTCSISQRPLRINQKDYWGRLRLVFYHGLASLGCFYILSYIFSVDYLQSLTINSAIPYLMLVSAIHKIYVTAKWKITSALCISSGLADHPSMSALAKMSDKSKIYHEFNSDIGGLFISFDSAIYEWVEFSIINRHRVSTDRVNFNGNDIPLLDKPVFLNEKQLMVVNKLLWVFTAYTLYFGLTWNTIICLLSICLLLFVDSMSCRHKVCTIREYPNTYVELFYKFVAISNRMLLFSYFYLPLLLSNLSSTLIIWRSLYYIPHIVLICAFVYLGPYEVGFGNKFYRERLVKN